jgi:hypothetical protein
MPTYGGNRGSTSTRREHVWKAVRSAAGPKREIGAARVVRGRVVSDTVLRSVRVAGTYDRLEHAWARGVSRSSVMKREQTFCSR